jgi:hypothetical protein
MSPSEEASLRDHLAAKPIRSYAERSGYTHIISGLLGHEWVSTVMHDSQGSRVFDDAEARDMGTRIPESGLEVAGSRIVCIHRISSEGVGDRTGYWERKANV